MRAHVHGVIATIAPVDSEARFRALGATVLRGEARFTDPATISVDGRAHDRPPLRRSPPAAERRFRRSRAWMQIQYWTNDSLFDLTERPDHLLILGGGPIGLEMADAFSGLGCRVTVVEAGRIAAKEDPELVAGLRQALAARGVAFREGVKVTGVDAGTGAAAGGRDAGRRVRICWWRSGGRPIWRRWTCRPGSIQAGPAGIATDRGLRSVSNKRVFAVGDIADPAGHRAARLHPCRVLSCRHRHPPRAVPPACADRLRARCRG